MNHPDTGDLHANQAVRRRLTLLYTDLTRSTALSRAIEPEYYRALLARLRRIWREAAQRHLGRLVLAQGDGALLVFGIDDPGEDDGRRAADAALAVHAQVAQLRPQGVPPAFLPLQMHTGIHAGTLLLSDGDIELGLFDLSGEVLNLAAALSKQAQPGQILVSLPSLGPHANCFALSPVPAPAGAMGPDDLAFQAHLRVVLGPGQATRRFEATAQRGLTPLIGRTDVLARLRAHIHNAVAPTRCLLLQGGPGLGKTRLLDELVREPVPAQCVLLQGGCESYLGAEVLQPFVQMLRVWFQRPARSRLPPDAIATTPCTRLLVCEDRVRGWVLSGGGAAGWSDTASGVIGDLQAFFAALSALWPCVLVIDDWQWADDASRQLLQVLLQLEAGPQVLLAARPGDDGGPWVADAPHLNLCPFNLAETSAVVQGLLDRPDPFLVARIHGYAGGVPLFAEELCHSALADQMLNALTERPSPQGWLDTLVVRRLERLPDAQACVVRAASVVGNVVPLRWLAAAHGQEPSSDTLQALVDADFLRADADGRTLRFKHGITRDAVYESIGLQQRMALHRRVEAALEVDAAAAQSDDTLESLAYHCRGAGHWAPAARYAEQAGDKAMAAFALDRARTQYLAAMDALDRQAEPGQELTQRWCLLANKLGLNCIFDPSALPDGLQRFERCVTLAQGCGDVATLARAEYWLGYMCYGVGRFREGVHHARRALQRARDAGYQRLAAQIEATLGQIFTAACRYDEAIALMDAALEAKQQHRRHKGGGIAIGSAYTLSCKGSILADRGAFDAAHACFAGAIDLLDGSTHPVANSVRSERPATPHCAARCVE